VALRELLVMSRDSARLVAGGEVDASELNFYSQIPEDLVFDVDVKHVDVRVFAALHRYGGTSGRRFPSLSTLGKRIGTSRDTVRRSVQNLERAGWVTVDQRPGASHLYVLHRAKKRARRRTGERLGNGTHGTSGMGTRGTSAMGTHSTGATRPKAITESNRTDSNGSASSRNSRARRSRAQDDDGATQRSATGTGGRLGPGEGWDSPETTKQGLAAARAALRSARKAAT
jgi:DNA-binding MarR family transcriptional regulator